MALKAGSVLHPQGHRQPASCSTGDPSALTIARVTKNPQKSPLLQDAGSRPVPTHPNFSPGLLGCFFPDPLQPSGSRGGTEGMLQAESRCFERGEQGKTPRRAAAAGPGMLRRLPGCDLRSGQEGAGEARARERARGAQGWGQPSGPGCASQKVQDQPDPCPTPPFTPTPRSWVRDWCIFQPCVSLHPFPCIRSHLKTSTER